jgi:hypothetical protein
MPEATFWNALMLGFLRIAAVVAIGFLVGGCTSCGGWSKFNSFPAPGACNSGEVK